MIGADAAEVTAHALAVTQSATEPFFLYVHYTGPHIPYSPPQTYRDEMGYPDPALLPAERAVAEDFLPYFWDHIDYRFGLKPAREFTPLSTIGQEAVRMLYDGEARYSDDKVGEFLEGLQSTHPNTVLILSADHGEHLWEHDNLGHAVSLYNALFRVPLVIQGPGVPAGQVINSNVSLISLLPTVADLLGLPARPAWEAESLFALHPPDEPTFSCTHGTAPPYDLDLEAIKLGAMKLILDERTQGIELYDVAADPEELTNLASTNPEQADALKALLLTHIQQNVRTRGGSDLITVNPAGWIGEGTKLTLTAPSGSRFQWIKDGRSLADDPPRVSGVGERTLTLDPAMIDDAGSYECMYDDGAKTWAMTRPYLLSVFPAGSLPAVDPAGLIALAALLAISAFSVEKRRSGC
jgi:arylsulfatase A-like enzyme